ncbi:hypothetical protein EOD42_23250 [Rhodovarius crocodyli]|uniref:Uncharacterized protein n=1 Tax=Rhodovarius crocodyli TaxID=1979269 RepID=A0A437LZ72_9PROT|nr:hypothetical protein [Rhodovarius crocodyli]RVT90721.1 hypothetical protein EOD42_23250 [Rhodovarius crocodyli]
MSSGDDAAVLNEEAADGAVVPPEQSDAAAEAQHQTTDEEAQAEDETTEEPEAPELVEFNFGGNKLTIPKGDLPDEVVAKVNDYTSSLQTEFQRGQEAAKRLEQDLGERVRATEELAKLRGEGLDLYAQVRQLDTELKELGKVSPEQLAQLWQTNPDLARQISDTVTAKREQFSAANQRLQQHLTAEKQQQEAFTAKEMDRLHQEGRERVSKLIPGFNEAVEKEIMDYAQKSFGLTAKQAQEWPLNPIAAQAMHKAMLYDRLMERAAKAAKPAPAPAAPVKPLRARSGEPKSDDQLSDEEYFRRHVSKPGGRG